MKKKLAIIKDGFVTNSILWDDENDFIPDERYLAVYSEVAGPGWLYDGIGFTQPEIIEEEI
jgi:hypothetical protein